MIVSAEKIVEEPDVEITTDTTVVGHAPAAPLPAAAPGAAMAPGTSAPAAAQPAAPAAAQPAAPAAAQPAAPLKLLSLRHPKLRPLPLLSLRRQRPVEARRTRYCGWV